MKRAIVLLLALGMLVGGLVGTGVADDEHPHMLIQRPVVGPIVEGDEVTGFELIGYRKCVDLAAGRPVPLHAHHANIHIGSGGGSAGLANAGHAVVPGAPLTPWADCAAFAAALPIPLR